MQSIHWSNHQSLSNTRETNFAKSFPKDMMFNKLPFTSLYNYAWGSLSWCFLQRFIHGSEVDGHAGFGRWRCSIRHACRYGVVFCVFFVFFFGASPDLASLDAIKYNQIKQVLWCQKWEGKILTWSIHPSELSTCVFFWHLSRREFFVYPRWFKSWLFIP